MAALAKRRQFNLEDDSNNTNNLQVHDSIIQDEENQKHGNKNRRGKRRISRLVQVQVHGEHSNKNSQNELGHHSQTSIQSQQQQDNSKTNLNNSQQQQQSIDEQYKEKYLMNHKFVKNQNEFLNFVSSPYNMSSIQSGTTGTSTNASKINSNNKLEDSDKKKKLRFDHKGQEIKPNGKHNIKFHADDKIENIIVVENWKEYNNIMDEIDYREKRCCTLI